MDPGLFYPDRGASAQAQSAKAVCAKCPVKTECLAYALHHREGEGIWGGLTSEERNGLCGKRGRHRSVFR